MQLDTAVRTAGPDDLATLAGLVREGRAGLAEQRGGELWLRRQAIAEPVEPALAALLADPDAFVGLASIDEVDLGLLIATHDADVDHRVATVHELFVVSDARGVGLGELLMDACVAWARRRDCEGIDGYALPGDRATKNFFETFGLVARGIVVHRRLPPDDPAPS